MASNRPVRDTLPLKERRRRDAVPRTTDPLAVNFDIFADLLSFYARAVVFRLNQDLDLDMAGLPVAKGTGKIATLLLIGANPGIRPSVVAYYTLRDRSALARLLDQLRHEGLIRSRVQQDERRAHELFLTAAGQKLAVRVRDIALRQNERFFGVLDAAEQASLLTVLKKLYRSRVTELPNGVRLANDEDGVR